MGSKHANLVKKGTDYSNHQSIIGSNLRGKVFDNGETTDQIIGKLALSNEHKEEIAKKLWLHFCSLLDEQGCQPVYRLSFVRA
jgi:hypothetical protein